MRFGAGRTFFSSRFAEELRVIALTTCSNEVQLDTSIMNNTVFISFTNIFRYIFACCPGLQRDEGWRYELESPKNILLVPIVGLLFFTACACIT